MGLEVHEFAKIHCLMNGAKVLITQGPEVRVSRRMHEEPIRAVINKVSQEPVEQSFISAKQFLSLSLSLVFLDFRESVSNDPRVVCIKTTLLSYKHT